jgi:hypothetical protein
MEAQASPSESAGLVPPSSTSRDQTRRHDPEATAGLVQGAGCARDDSANPDRDLCCIAVACYSCGRRVTEETRTPTFGTTI